MTKHQYELAKRKLYELRDRLDDCYEIINDGLGDTLSSVEKLRITLFAYFTDLAFLNALKDAFDEVIKAITIADKIKERGCFNENEQFKKALSALENCWNVISSPEHIEEAYSFTSLKKLFKELDEYNKDAILIYPSDSDKRELYLIVCDPSDFDALTERYPEEPRYIAIKELNELIDKQAKKQHNHPAWSEKTVREVACEKVVRELIRQAEKDRIELEAELGIRTRIYDWYRP